MLNRINNTLELTVTATIDVATDTSTIVSVAATNNCQDVTMPSTDDNIGNKYLALLCIYELNT